MLKHGTRAHLRLPPCFGPCRECRSRELSLSVPPLNFPRLGPPTLFSRRCWTFGELLTFSRITPFSVASFRRLASRLVALATMPLRCDAGIFCWDEADPLAPKSFNRRSRALSLPLPSTVEALGLAWPGFKRCDSFSSRCKSRSCLRLVASTGSSSLSTAVGLCIVRVELLFESGGRDDWMVS